MKRFLSITVVMIFVFGLSCGLFPAVVQARSPHDKAIEATPEMGVKKPNSIKNKYKPEEADQAQQQPAPPAPSKEEAPKKK